MIIGLNMGKMTNDHKGGKDMKRVQAKLCGDKVIPLENVLDQRVQRKMKASKDT